MSRAAYIRINSENTARIQPVMTMKAVIRLRFLVKFPGQSAAPGISGSLLCPFQ